MNNSLSKHKLDGKFTGGNGSTVKALNSTKSLTKTELSRFFRDTTNKIDADAKSRITEISRGNYKLKNPLGVQSTKTRDASVERDRSPDPEARKTAKLTRENSEEAIAE